jgi:hypothetical protein
VGVQEVRWDTGGTLIPGVIIIFTENKKEIISEQVFKTDYIMMMIMGK